MAQVGNKVSSAFKTRLRRARDYLVIPHHHKAKNIEWSEDTPNERAQTSVDYVDFVRMWQRMHGYAKPTQFLEVRITRQRSELEIHRSSAWWDQKMFMEKIFWVFQKPEIYYPAGKAPYSLYLLEPLECHRVYQMAVSVNAHRAWATAFPALLVPCDCVEQCFDETSAGYSDHIRPREPVRKTELEKEVTERVEAEVRRMQSEVKDVSADDSWNSAKERYVEPVSPTVRKLLER